MTRFPRILAVLLLGLLVGCERASDVGSGEGAAGGKRVVATTMMIGDLVRQIAGDRVQLKVIMGPGVDPHTYKPSTSDLGEMRRADLVLYNGLHLEGKMTEQLEQSLRERAIAVTRDVPEGELLGWQAGQGGAHDPHIWFDVTLWQRAAQTVRDGLIQIDPANADAYRANTDQLLERMGALDEYVRQQIGSIPPEHRVVVTSHDAYNYFGEAYGVEVRGLQGISTETEAGLASINSAVDYILQRRIPAIFVESSVSPKTIQRVQADCAARGFNVQIGGELYSDAMGSPGEHTGYAVETYDGMVRYNVDTIVKALKGSAEGQ